MTWGRGVRIGRRGSWGVGQLWGASGALAERTRLEGCGSRFCAAERTANMPAMVVTLDVSKLTGWLKAAALCRDRR